MQSKEKVMTKDEALDLALEALELSSVTVDSFGVQRKTQEAITAIKQALAAPVQECLAHGECFGGKCIYTTPPAAQRQWVGLTDEEIIKAMPGGIYDCLNDPWDCGVGDGDTLRSIKKDVLRIARAIETKLKEKNNG